MGQELKLSDRATQWVRQALGARANITRVATLAGATSSSLYRVEVQEGSHAYRVVLRLFTNEEWLTHEPDLARHEAAALQQAIALDVPGRRSSATPRLIAFDETGATAGVPAVLMTEVPGRVDLRPADLNDWLRQLAEALVPLHRLQAPDFPWNYYTYNDLTALAVPAWSKVPSAWAEAIRFAQGPRPEKPTCFIHRDYHPVNVLWDGSGLSGIVDWVNACRGPADKDLGHCRLNLAQLYGNAAADGFLEHYQAAAGSEFSYHPYWDIISVLDSGVFEGQSPGLPPVHRGWLDFGMRHLTPAIVAERLDAYICSLVARIGS